MKKLFFSIILLFALSTYGQDSGIDKNFIADFTKALDKSFSEEQLNAMFQTYSALLTPHSDVTQLSEKLQGHLFSVFPLHDFKSEKLYTDNIHNLINSINPNQRILAYLVIASSGDTTKENILLGKLKLEKEKGNLIWAGMALLYLNCRHTTALFDFLVKNEDFSDAHMLPLFFKLNKDSLQQTAYKRIHSEDETAKILAAQVLSVTTLNTKTEELLKQVVQDWNINIKGYAIYSIGQLQIGNLLNIFKPLLDSTQTREIALDALANSPTENDRKYLFELINKQDTISTELLDCLYKSKNIENLKYWLNLLSTKPIPKKYVFFVFEQPLLHTDSILTELQASFLKVKTPEILSELVRALEHRSDDKSVDIILSLLSNNDANVRYWAARIAKDNPSAKLQDPSIKDLVTQILNEAK